DLRYESGRRSAGFSFQACSWAGGRPPALACGRGRLLHPVGDEDVRLPFHLRVAVGCENEAPSVGGKHRETVERLAERDLLEAGSVQVDDEHVEVALLRVLVVRREDQTLAVRMP